MGRAKSDEDVSVVQLGQVTESERSLGLVPLEGGRVVECQRHLGVSPPQRLGEGHRIASFGAAQLWPDEVGAGIGVGAPAANGLVQTAPHRAAGVGAGDDDEVGIALCLDSRAVLANRLLEWQNVLASQ